MGETEAEVAATEQTLAQAFDLRNDLIDLVYPFAMVKDAAAYQQVRPHARPARFISDCYLAVQFNYFIPGFLSCSVAVFSEVSNGYNPSPRAPI
jgi:hypothetical protein